MAAQTAITVFDGAATPVVHIFVPIDNKVLKDGTRYSLWREYNAALPTEACQYIEAFQKKLAGGVLETKWFVYTPVMESVGSQNAAGYTAPPKVAYYEKDGYIKQSHPRSTGIIRNTNTQILRNLLTNTATTVTPNSAGPVFDSVITQVMPS